MIPAELLDILCCPETHQGLRVAERGQIENLNAQVKAGTLRNRAGQIITELLDSGLVRNDGKVLYPVRQDIPVMLVEEGLLLS
jgi:uncharacterized protein